MSADPEATVRALLAVAGLLPSDDEIARLVVAYPLLRAAADTLYDVAEARYEETAQSFAAVPRGSDWRRRDAPGEPPAH